jgi:plastocyanin
MSNTPHEPLVGEVRFRVPLPIVVPFLALATIALVTIAFGKLLLALPHEAALIIAAVTAANVLAACAFIALRGGMHSQSILELLAIMLYPVLIGVVIVQVGAFEHSAAADAAHAPLEGEAPAAGGGLVVTSANVAFDTETIELTAGEETTIEFVNEDSLEHNISIYETAADGTSFTGALFEGEIIPGGESITYTVPALEEGEKYFQCDVHPNMNGTASVK